MIQNNFKFSIGTIFVYLLENQRFSKTIKIKIKIVDLISWFLPYNPAFAFLFDISEPPFLFIVAVNSSTRVDLVKIFTLVDLVVGKVVLEDLWDKSAQVRYLISFWDGMLIIFVTVSS
jgi:hypothetical protein